MCVATTKQIVSIFLINNTNYIIYNAFYKIIMINSTLITKAVSAAEKPLLIETSSQLASASESWEHCAILGVDTEFLRERTYRAELGLVQVSDGTTAWLIDMVKLESFEPLQQMFTNPSILKVFHSSSEDLEVLWNTLSVSPQPMIDTQVACAMLGNPLQMSYHHMVKQMIGIEVDKEQTRSNWIRRPLKPEQLHYAATDVVFLPAMAEDLKQDLQDCGRWEWLEQDVEQMIHTSQQTASPERAYLRFKRTHKLETSALNVLKALAAWRETTASKRNLARGFVIPDSVLLQLAYQKPSTEAEIQQIEDLHPRAAERYQSTLLKIIDQYRNAMETLEQSKPVSIREKKLINEMRDQVQKKAEELEIEPALLASRKQLEALIHSQASGRPIPERLQGWRQEVISEQLLNLAERENNR
jgi:ribonuclease D